tara:strand:- start:123 stop:563 length:441 start_codon:yes stop_codon:yes gene_type:complete
MLGEIQVGLSIADLVSKTIMKNIFVILGNQLFEPSVLKSHGCNHVFMAEDHGLCTYEKHHKLKIYLFFCAMREYRDELINSGIQVSYFSLEQRDKAVDYTSFLHKFLKKNEIRQISLFEIEDRPFLVLQKTLFMNTQFKRVFLILV